ncbi:MAG: hypothetical protein ABG776_19690 [Cyanobacteria bacterium J06555_13]
MTPSSSSTLGPLQPGNVVSAALRLYRDRFKMYLSLSVRAYLWLFVPVYGWAKYGMYTGVMSRLAYKELIDQPETSEDSLNALQPKMWGFLGVGLLLGCLFVGAYIAIALASVIVAFIIGGLLGVIGGLLLGAEFGGIIGGVVGAIVFFLALMFGLLWVVGRLLIAEVPLAIEPLNDVTKSIGRSWLLSAQSIWRIQFVVLAAFLTTLPLLLVTSYLPQIPLLAQEPGTPEYWTLYFIVLIPSLIGNMLVLPFWQVVKGVLYYDLRSRREGLDLEITDSPIMDSPR